MARSGALVAAPSPSPVPSVICRPHSHDANWRTSFFALLKDADPGVPILKPPKRSAKSQGDRSSPLFQTTDPPVPGPKVTLASFFCFPLGCVGEKIMGALFATELGRTNRCALWGCGADCRSAALAIQLHVSGGTACDFEERLAESSQGKVLL